MQKILTGKAREQYDEVPRQIDGDDLARHFTLSDTLLKHVRQRRGEQSKFVFALQWCWLDYLGWIPSPGRVQPRNALQYVAKQLGIKLAEIEETSRSNWYWIAQQVATLA
ncbi:MAG: DUF4158 domain-containing protein, partial [Anaerolineae bacterium]|nr:DUF4158 domain-containing protein [Anaerolineae bacterium]